jgi:WD40 repeat protein
VPMSYEELDAAAVEVRRLRRQAEAALASGDAPKAFALVREALDLPGYSKDRELTVMLQKAGCRGRISSFAAGWIRLSMENCTGPASLVFTPQGPLGLSGGEDSSIKTWDLESGRSVRSVPLAEAESAGPGPSKPPLAKTVAFSADGSLALTGDRVPFLSHRSKTKCSVRLTDLRAGRVLHVMGGHEGEVYSVALSADGKLGVSASADKTVRLWDLAKGACVRVLEGHTEHVNAVALSPDGRFALSGGGGRTTGNVFLGCYDNALRLWDLATGRCLQVLEGHTDGVRAVAVTPQMRLAVSAGNDRTLRLWDLAAGRCLRVFQGHTDHVVCLALTPDGRWMISGSADKTLRLWNLAQEKCQWTFDAHTVGVDSVSISPDGHWVLSSGGQTHLWELVWGYEFPGPADWDSAAQTYLETFLTLRCPYAVDGVRRAGQPKWTDAEFQNLLIDLRARGFGWLRSDGVRHELELLTMHWQGPPAAAWE